MICLKRLFCAAILCTFAMPSFAQSTFLEQISRTGMTQDDINIMTQTASEMYVGRSAIAGSETAWSNPATEAYGTAKITGVEANCVNIGYVFHTKSRPEARPMNVRRCKQDGKWIMAN